MTDAPLAISTRLYNIRQADLRPVRGGHVSQVYSFNKAGQEYILRLTPTGEDLDLPGQRASLAWMAFLAGEGVCVSRPIPSINNNLIETIHEEEGDWLAVVQTKAAGVLSEELPLREWDANLFAAVGRAVGGMHAASRRYHPSVEASRPDWDRCSNLFNWKDFGEPWLEAKAVQLRQMVQSLPKTRDNYGMIHADLHFGNFYVDVPAKAVTIIDFDDICMGWYIMDLAILLFDVLVLYEGPDRQAYAFEFLQPLLNGYRQVNGLDPFMLEQIPLFAKLLEINIYAEIAAVSSSGMDWWGRKFMTDRRERIENDIPYLALDLKNLDAG